MSSTPGDDQEPQQDSGEGWWQQQSAGGAPPPPGYGAPPPPGYGAPPPTGYAVDHPQTTTVLVLGILGLALCQLVAPFAWVMGRRVLREIDAAGGRIGGRGPAQVGYVLGIVGTIILGVSLLFLVGYAVVALALFASGGGPG